MKKWWYGGLVFMVLAGCANGEDSTENESEEQEFTDETDDISEENTEETDGGSTDSEDQEELVIDDGEDTDQMQFVTQISDEESGLTVGNDEILSMLNDLIENSRTNEIGDEGQVRAQYSGLFLTDETNLLYGVFLLSNRTEEAMTNIGITLSVATEDDVLFDNKSIYLDQEHFGILEPDTVMPVYVELDINQLESVEELSDSRQETTYISDVMFDVPGENPDSRDPEGFEVGYRPEYIMAQANEENREGQWEESAPELEYVLPDNIDQGDISTALIHVEQIVDLAAMESIDNDISIFWAGVAEQDGNGEDWKGIFLLMNRTGEDFQNIEFGFTLEDENGETVFENQSISLPEEEFGVLRDGTMMPVSITVPEEGEAVFMGIIEQYGAVYRFESWEAE
ncbi:hypothetical protein [Alkalibacterium thalassium]|uniref:Uncharacterized protein n=1 Tax=Alkalibacterium thalassium TaxID=426701 RepID=A0A1G9FHY0_9LACT|nr:hypothetical protein [Alkalibacterium thalassium]SDK87989.1 hypothetical protein SAMN04488098_10797 [Alkalibacterium thalassium]